MTHHNSLPKRWCRFWAGFFLLGQEPCTSACLLWFAIGLMLVLLGPLAGGPGVALFLVGFLIVVLAAVKTLGRSRGG